jgi:hypothetical protein
MAYLDPLYRYAIVCDTWDMDYISFFCILGSIWFMSKVMGD